MAVQNCKSSFVKFLITVYFVVNIINTVSKIYVFGGFNGSYLNKAEVYDPITNRWTALPPMPTARAGLASAVIGDKIYVIGGWSPSAPLGTVEIFDTLTQTWSGS